MAISIELFNPPHVGNFLKTEIVEAHGLSVTQAADMLGVSRQALSTFLNGKSDLSADMAIRFEKVFGIKMDTLLRMHNMWTIAQARKRAPFITNVQPFVPAIHHDYP